MSATVVNFAAVLNERRAAAESARHEAARAERLERQRREIAETLGGTAGAHIVADVITNLKAKDDATRPLPAYCDPSNEVRGSKFEATRGLRGAEIAARIRQDIKDAQKAGLIPPGFKISTRFRSYSGGQAIDVRVTDIPPGFPMLTAPAAAWIRQFGRDSRRDPPIYWKDRQSPELRAVLDRLEAIHGAYNRDNSDSMTDYFDRRFYGHVSVESGIQRAREDEQAATAAADYWSPDCNA